MVPRLPFQEWEGFNAGESAQQMTGASRAWPGLSLLTLADIKTAAWLVENSHLTHLERIIFSTNLHTQSVNTEVQTIKRVAGTVSDKSDDQIFKPVQGNLNTTSTGIFNLCLTLSIPVVCRCDNISTCDPSYSCQIFPHHCNLIK